MSTRPASITVIGIILMIFGGFGVLAMLMFIAMKDSPFMQPALQMNPMPVSVQIAFGLVGTLVYILCGALLLLRQGWARYAYILWNVFSIAYTLYTSPYSPLLLIPSVVILAVAVYFMFTPPVRAWFRKQDAAPAT